MARSWTGLEASFNASVPLVAAIASYPVLEAVVSHLRPDDLVTLTTVCQTVNNQIRMHEKKVKANLLSKTLCPGVGLRTRAGAHCPCRTKDWHKYIGCAGEGYDADSKPCIECGINTCDECRIHVIYQTFMDDDSGLDNRRWWAGYIFTFRNPFALYPPLGPEKAGWYLPNDLTHSHHDQGRLHAPLHIDAIADAEPLDRILDFNLGRHMIPPWGRTAMPFHGRNMVDLFRRVAAARYQFTCGSCFASEPEGSRQPCSCTLRKHFVDRWVCIPCSTKESMRLDSQFPSTSSSGHDALCQCGSEITVGRDEFGTTCGWCDGYINAPDQTYVEGDMADEETYVNNDDEDDNAGPAPAADLPPDAQAYVENKDATLSVYHGGTRISGERLSRTTVRRWLYSKGSEIPCTCCKCPVEPCDYHRHESESGSEHSNSGGEGEDEENEDGDSVDMGEAPGTSGLDDVIDFGDGVEPEVFE